MEDGPNILAHLDRAGLLAAIRRKYQGGSEPQVIKYTVTSMGPEWYVVTALVVSAKDQWGKTQTAPFHFVINKDDNQGPLLRTPAFTLGAELDSLNASAISMSNKIRNNIDIQQRGGVRTSASSYLVMSKPLDNILMQRPVQNLAAILNSSGCVTLTAALLSEETDNEDKNQIYSSLLGYTNDEMKHEMTLPEFMLDALNSNTGTVQPMSCDRNESAKLCVVHGNDGFVAKFLQTTSVSDVYTRTSSLENAKLVSIIMLAFGITDEHANDGVYSFVMDRIDTDSMKRINFIKAGTLPKANFSVAMRVRQELLFLSAGFPPARRGSNHSPEHFAKLVAAGRFPGEFSEILRSTLEAFNKDAMSLPVLDFFSKSSNEKKRKQPVLDEGAASADAASLGF